MVANAKTSTTFVVCNAIAVACHRIGLEPAHAEVTASETYPMGRKNPSPPPVVNWGRNVLACFRRTKSSDRRYVGRVRQEPATASKVRLVTTARTGRLNRWFGPCNGILGGISRHQHHEHQCQSKRAFGIHWACYSEWKRERPQERSETDNDSRHSNDCKQSASNDSEVHLPCTHCSKDPDDTCLNYRAEKNSTATPPIQGHSKCVNKDRTLTINQEPVAIENLQDRLRLIFATRANKVIFVRGHRDLDFPRRRERHRPC